MANVKCEPEVGNGKVVEDVGKEVGKNGRGSGVLTAVLVV